MHKRKNITCIYNVIWYGPSRIRSPSCASWHDLHHSTGVAPRSMACHLGCLPPLQYITWIYIWHTGHLNENTTIWLLPVVYNLQKGSLHIICNINNLTISHHMPCKNKLDVSNLSCIFYVVWCFLGRTVLTYEHVTTTVIKILSTTICKIDYNYSGRNMHPQSHICQSMSSVGQVSWTRSRKVSLGQLQSHYATMIQNTKNCNNMIINTRIPMCSNRAYPLRIEMALIPLMGS
jgi:hypothetical protein